MLGVNLGCALDDVESNLQLIKDLKNARINLILKEQDSIASKHRGNKLVDDFPKISLLTEFFSLDDNNSGRDEIDLILENIHFF